MAPDIIYPFSTFCCHDYYYVGDKSVPQVFFNSRHVGGWEEVERLEREGVLGERVRECLEGGSEEFPPPLWTPEPQELVQVT